MSKVTITKTSTGGGEMGSSKIEWLQNADGTPGKVWNPITGCTKISEGCKNCYAERMFNRKLWDYDFTPGTVHEDRWSQPQKWKDPKRIFCCSMGDLFHDDVDIQAFVSVVIQATWHCQRHTFMCLTKRPQNMARAVEWYRLHMERELPPNLWLGVTAENQHHWDHRVHHLRQIPAAVRFVSVEPMLGPIQPAGTHLRGFNHLDWVICGAETGPGKRPMADQWAYDLVTQCHAADVPFFFKKDSRGNGTLAGQEWKQIPSNERLTDDDR